MRSLHLLAGLISLLMLAPAASAVYWGTYMTQEFATVVLDPSNPNQTTQVLIYRVWACFTNPTDAVISWGGGGVLGNAGIYMTNGASPGPGFLNHVNGGLLPPESTAASEADSFLTISVTQLSQIPPNQGISLIGNPGNPPDVQSPIISMSAGGGVTTNATTSNGDPNPIAMAGFTGDGSSSCVLLMQLVVPFNPLGVYARFGLTYRSGGVTTTVQNQVAFNTLEQPHLGACCMAKSCAHLFVFDCVEQGGAWHNSTAIPMALPCGTACMLGDITGDYDVDVDDLLAVIQLWGACPPYNCPGLALDPCFGNLNSDCVVNVDDLLVVIMQWSP